MIIISVLRKNAKKTKSVAALENGTGSKLIITRVKGQGHQISYYRIRDKS
jgi:hypothetical protein